MERSQGGGGYGFGPTAVEMTHCPPPPARRRRRPTCQCCQPEGSLRWHRPLQDFYIACSLGGIVACGLTHTMVTPLDVVKCNLQTDPKNYTGIAQVGLPRQRVWHLSKAL